MNISYNWLKDYINPELSPVEVAAVLTQLGEIGAQWPLVTAGTVIVVGPLLILFPIFQRQFIDSFLHSGLK